MPNPDDPTDACERRIRERAASVVRTQATALTEGTTHYRDLSRALSCQAMTTRDTSAADPAFINDWVPQRRSAG